MTEMTELEILKGVRDLLADPVHWTKGAYARFSQGSSAAPILQATCWCVNGAWAKVTGKVYRHYTPNLGGHPMDKLLVGCVPAKYNWASALFNDECTHEELMAALSCAIAKREAPNA